MSFLVVYRLSLIRTSSMTESRKWVTATDSFHKKPPESDIDGEIRNNLQRGILRRLRPFSFSRSIFSISISLRLAIRTGGSHLPKRVLLHIYFHISMYAGLNSPNGVSHVAAVLPLTPTKTLFRSKDSAGHAYTYRRAFQATLSVLPPSA
jgi:hypothetical protein